MKFKTVKNGFDPSEVEAYIKRLREVYEKTLLDQRDRIFEQREAIETLETKLTQHEKEKEVVNKSLESAVAKADEIKSAAKSKYAEEIASLREFHEIWVQYFARIKQKYPIDDEIDKMSAMDAKIKNVLGDADTYVPRSESGNFNPVSMIETHLAATEPEEEGFDYFAAQNPEDDLQSILGDLGIIFDE